MCARLEMNEVVLRPGDFVSVWESAQQATRLRWTGFARSEILDWWQRHGGELVDVPARRFAERSDVSDDLVWNDLPSGKVVRGLVDHEGEECVLRIVTRPATAPEMLHFQHLRAPLIEPPLYSAECPPTVGLPLFDETSRRRRAAHEAVQELLFQ